MNVDNTMNKAIEIAAGTRSLSTIATEIKATWPKVSVHAAPYLGAMESMSSMNEQYGAEDADSIILYFLSNAQGWRGADAKRIKLELKGMLK